MNFKSIAVAAALVVSSAASFAATPVVFAGDVAEFGTSYKNVATTFSEEFTFSGLAAGTYSILGDLSGSNLTFSKVTLTANGVTTAWDIVNVGAKFGLATIEVASGVTPFSVHVDGIKIGSTKNSSNFQGSLTVTAVPEPESYAMLLAGLGVMGAIARRRSSKQA